MANLTDGAAPGLQPTKLQHVVLALARNFANLPSWRQRRVLCNLAPVLAVALLLDVPNIKDEHSNSANAWAGGLGHRSSSCANARSSPASVCLATVNVSGSLQPF
jgi:hypothetical protein